MSPEIARVAGRDLRTMRALIQKYPPNKENVDEARQAYAELPPEIQQGIPLGLAQAAGSIVGGMIASYLVAGACGRMAARLAVITLGARGTVHAPHWRRLTTIAGGAMLSWYAIMGSTVDYIQTRNQLMAQLTPEQRAAVNAAVDDLLRRQEGWPDPDADGSKGTKKHD